MTVKELVGRLNFKVIAGQQGLDKTVSGVYICDLLSWVMAHAQKGNAWITVQTNINIVAVAVLTEVSCVIIPENISIDQNTINKAEAEGIVLLSSPLTSYEIACHLNEISCVREK